MKAQLKQDQEDFFHRISSDEFFADVKVLMEDTGNTEADIDQSLNTLLAKAAKAGACVVVLMPSLGNDSPNAPGPRYVVRMTCQVIDQPLTNLGDSGTKKSVAEISERVRMICHHFNTGRGNVYALASQEPIPVDVGKNSYGVVFTRPGGDAAPRKVGTPVIDASADDAPATLTITCATAGATIHYTLDGSPPYASNPAALVYSAPVNLATAATVRAAASLAEHQPSDITRRVIY